MGGPEYSDKSNLLGVFKHSGISNWSELIKSKFEAVEVIFSFRKLKKNYQGYFNEGLTSLSFISEPNQIGIKPISYKVMKSISNDEL